MSCGPTNQDGTTWGQAFAYDPFGNITKTVPLSMTGISWQPGYNTQNQYRLGGTSYDADGNLTADTFNTYAWDSDGNTIGVNLNGSSPVSIKYDALDRAVEENNSGTYKQILYGPTGGKLALMARQSASSVFVPLPGGEEATYTGSTIRFRHYDWLGSARFESNMTQHEYGDAAYAPFVEPYSIKDTPYLSFTGAQQDTVSGTYDFLYREYNPVQGRWIRPDPAGLSAVDATYPQSWNRYAYVGNSPLSRVDPLGLQQYYAPIGGQGLSQNYLKCKIYPASCALEQMQIDFQFMTGDLTLQQQEALYTQRLQATPPPGFIWPAPWAGPGCYTAGGDRTWCPPPTVSSSLTDLAANNQFQLIPSHQPQSPQPPLPKPYDPGTFLNPSKDACNRINKKAKVDLFIAGGAAATGFLAPITAPVAEPVAAAEGLMGGGEELYMAFFCE